jgi:hypothetical protein
MRCWICGAEGNTGEHLVKASDLRKYFGPVTQRKPLYFHTKTKSNIRFGSIKSRLLKSKALICNRCNSALTQPYDRAWEELYSYIVHNWSKIFKTRQINMKKVFPGCSNKSLLYVHLYFIKIFGCQIAENSIPIDISRFSYSLINQTSHPDIYIKIGSINYGVKHKHAGLTPVETINKDGKTVFATWLYSVGSLVVDVIYNVVPNNDKVLRDTWQPGAASKFIRFVTD